MLFSRKLITKFIPEFVNITDEKLTQTLNALGMEVESITKYPKINNVVIGQLLSFKPVEGTHLNLCQVKINANQINTIVCGASGLKEGIKVIVALEGAKLPSGITISKRMIHGMESNGMMCAYNELTGVNSFIADDEKNEIIMLKDGEVGSDKWPELIGTDDTIYDVTIPANRNDENAYLVFCYEIANKLNLKFNFDLDSVQSVPNNAQKADVDETVCDFLGFFDYDIASNQTSRSGWVFKSMLMNHGIKPINQMLDRLAYITLLTNAPTHVYDLNKINGHMNCRLCNDEVKFAALNGKTYSLNKKDIIICDDSQPVSIAAVIGSDNTKLTNKTTRARIELGNFNYVNVRNTAIRLNCETDASKKASRPLSTFLNLVATHLIRKYFGEPTKQSIYINENWNKNKININYDKLSWFINEHLSKKFVVNALRKLGYKNGFFTPCKFKVPSWRLDVKNQADLYEDILKIIDMNKLKPISIADNLLPIIKNQEYEIKQSLKEIFLNNYFSEVKTYNLTNKNNLDKFNLFESKDPIKIMANNANREYFRLNMLDNMLKIYKYNDARKLDLHPIFEIQKLFTNNHKTMNLTALSLDKYIVDSITNSSIAINLNYYKALVNQMAKLLNANVFYKPVESKYFYNNESLSIIYNNQIVGYIGKIKSSCLKDYDLSNKQVYVLSMNLNSMIADYAKADFHVKSFGVFQRLSKDANIILDASNAQLVNSKIEEIKKIKDIADVKIINIFNKDNKIVYTIRYYLVDTRQFNTNDLEIISKQVENLSRL